MARQRDREAFVGVVVAEGGTVAQARALMRYSATLHRLAEAQCNGDWPADNGERKVKTCSSCECSWAPSVLKIKATTRQIEGLAWTVLIEKGLAVDRGAEGHFSPELLRLCPDCRTTARVHAMLEGTPFKADTAGDPRGAVVRLRVPSGRDEGWGGVAVP